MLSDYRKKAISLAYEGFMGEVIAEKMHVVPATIHQSWGIKVREIRKLKKEGMSLKAILDKYEQEPTTMEIRRAQTLLALEKAKIEKTNLTTSPPQNTKVMVAFDRLEEMHNKLDKILEYMAKF